MSLRDERSFGERWVAKWRSPHSLTTLIPIVPSSADASPDALWEQLHAREAAITEDLSSFERLHALRLVVVPGTPERPMRLLINSMSDDDFLDHARTVARVLAPHLHGVLPCAGSADDLARGILEHRAPESTLFLAAPGITVADIRAETRLRVVLREWFERSHKAGALKRMTLDESRRAAAAHVRSLRDRTCASSPPPPPEGEWRRRVDFGLTFLFPLIGVLGKDIMEAVERVKEPSRHALLTAMVSLWWLYAGGFVGAAMVGVRLLELLEPHVELPNATVSKLERLEAVESRRVKNELTELFPVKPSWLGRAIMRAVLFGAERGVRHIWTSGRLAGAQNIHFARFVTIDGGRNTIFMSDYEGGFEAYIDHFIGVGGHPRAVVPISSRVVGSPKTRWLYWPENAVEYRRQWGEFARRNQLQAAVRYVAYPSVSANDVLNHRAIRRGLFAEQLSPRELEEWVQRI